MTDYDDYEDDYQEHEKDGCRALVKVLSRSYGMDEYISELSYGNNTCTPDDFEDREVLDWSDVIVLAGDVPAEEWEDFWFDMGKYDDCE